MGEIKERWSKAMPKFFKMIFSVAAAIGVVALAINTAMISGGATPPEWWNEIFPYLLGISGGAAAVAKFTVKGGMEKESGNTILDKDNF